MARLDPADPHALAPAFLAHHLDVIEGKFDAVLQMLSDREDTEWFTTKEVLPLMSVTSKQLSHLLPQALCKETQYGISDQPKMLGIAITAVVC